MSVFTDQQMEVIRAAFERHMGRLNPAKVGAGWFLRWDGSAYEDQRTQDMWHGWRMACLALVTP